MGAFAGIIIAAIVGVLLAIVAGLGLVSTQSALPATVDAPYITYDG